MDAPLYVLIPTHGRPDLLGRTLATLATCERPAAYRETIVVENGPKAGAEAVVAEVAAAHPDLRLRYLHVERANKSHALNEALATVDDGLAVFFDDDVRLEPGVLTAYAEAASGKVHGAYFGGPVEIDYERPPPSWLVPYLPHSARGYALHDRGTMSEEYLGFNWAAFVDDIRDSGGFDPGFGPGSPTGATGQESDMQRRIRERGARPYDVPEALVWHAVPRSRSSPRWLLRRHYRMGLSQNLEGGQSFQTLGVNMARAVASLGKQLLKANQGGAMGALCGLFASVGAMRAHLIHDGIPLKR